MCFEFLVGNQPLSPHLNQFFKLMVYAFQSTFSLMAPGGSGAFIRFGGFRCYDTELVQKFCFWGNERQVLFKLAVYLVRGQTFAASITAVVVAVIIWVVLGSSASKACCQVLLTTAAASKTSEGNSSRSL